MRTLLLVTLLIYCSSVSHSIDTIYPASIIELSSTILDDPFSDHSYYYTLELILLYNLTSTQSYVYSRVGFLYYDCMGIGCIPYNRFADYSVYQINTNNHLISLATSPYNSSGISNLENMVDSALWSNGQITLLENSYSPRDNINESGVYVDYAIQNLAWNEKHDSKNSIAGLIRWETEENFGHDWQFEYTLNFWDGNSGKLMHNIKIPYGDKQIEGLPVVTKICFSKNAKFLLFNFSGKVVYHKNYDLFLSYAFLVNTETYEFLLANRDVAFTSDDRYYVTERDGLPSLVDATTHEVLQRYDPGATMSACCFSPDDQILYMACDDLKIYQFDSHLPSSAAGNWELME